MYCDKPVEILQKMSEPPYAAVFEIKTTNNKKTTLTKFWEIGFILERINEKNKNRAKSGTLTSGRVSTSSSANPNQEKQN
jgi:hypothetical protein